MNKRPLVDAAELIDWIKKEVHVKDLSDGAGLCKVIFADDFERALSRFPGKAIEIPVIKRGKWILAREHVLLANGDYKEWDNFFCSECDTPSSRPTYYCPDCGARMDGRGSKGEDTMKLKDCEALTGKEIL